MVSAWYSLGPAISIPATTTAHLGLFWKPLTLLKRDTISVPSLNPLVCGNCWMAMRNPPKHLEKLLIFNLLRAHVLLHERQHIWNQNCFTVIFRSCRKKKRPINNRSKFPFWKAGLGSFTWILWRYTTLCSYKSGLVVICSTQWLELFDRNLIIYVVRIMLIVFVPSSNFGAKLGLKTSLLCMVFILVDHKSSSFLEIIPLSAA